MGFPDGSAVKNPPAVREMEETQVQSLGREDPLEKEPTPVFLPGKSHGPWSLVGYNLWGHKESDRTADEHEQEIDKMNYFPNFQESETLPFIKARIKKNTPFFPLTPTSPGISTSPARHAKGLRSPVGQFSTTVSQLADALRPVSLRAPQAIKKRHQTPL